MPEHLLLTYADILLDALGHSGERYQGAAPDPEAPPQTLDDLDLPLEVRAALAEHLG